MSSLNPNRNPKSFSNEDMARTTHDRHKQGFMAIDSQKQAEFAARVERDHDYALQLEMVGGAIDRVEKAARAMGIDDDSWADSEDGIDGGTALVELANRLHEGARLTGDDATFLGYENSVIEAYEARATVNEEKLRNTYPAEDNTFNDAALAYLTQEASEAKKLDKWFKSGDEAKRQQAIDESNMNPLKLSGKVRNIRRTIKAIEKVEKDEPVRNYGNEFMQAAKELQEDPGNSEKKTAYEKAKFELRKSEDNFRSYEVTYAMTSFAFPPEEGEYIGPSVQRRIDANNAAREANMARKAQTTLDRTMVDPDDDDETTTAPVPVGASVGAATTTNTTAATSGTPTSAAPAAGNNPNQQSPANDPNQQPTGAGSGSTPPPAGGNNPPAGAGGENGNNNSSAHEKADAEATLLGLQRRLANAKEALAYSGRKRSATFIGAEYADEHKDTAALHNDVRDAALNLLRFEQPRLFDDTSNIPSKERLTLQFGYVTDQYRDITNMAVQAMGGEKDAKKRKRNKIILRVGATAAGLIVGGPAGALLGASIAQGIVKARDHEFNNRDRLRNAIKEYEAQHAADLVENNHMAALEAATDNLREQFEKGFVQERRRIIGSAVMRGTLWGVGTYVAGSMAADALSYAGSEFRHWISTLDNPLGNPGYNYVPKEKPMAISFADWLLSMPTAGKVTLGAGALGAAAAVKFGYDTKNKPQTRNRNQNRSSSNGSNNNNNSGRRTPVNA